MMTCGQEGVPKPHARLHSNITPIIMHAVLFSKSDKLDLFKDMKSIQDRHTISAHICLIISQNKITNNSVCQVCTACPLDDTYIKMNTIFHGM